MLTIYHNPRCGKSRCALQRLEQAGQTFRIVEYLKNPPSELELRHILTLLGKTPFEIIRQKEIVFQEKFKGQTFSDDEWIQILLDHPVLIERPIVTIGDKAWVARDEQSLADLVANFG